MHALSISVIMPCYNASSTVRDSIMSVLNQSIYDEVELICVDDGSTDETLAILKQIASHNDSNVLMRILEHQTCQGLSSARNTGIASAANQIVMFLDADDAFLPDALSYVADTFALNNISYLISSGVVRNCSEGRVNCPDWLQDILSVNVLAIHRYLNENMADHIDSKHKINYGRHLSSINAVNSRDIVFCHHVKPFVQRFAYLRELNLTFDESLIVTEDMHFMIRALITKPGKIHLTSFKTFEYRWMSNPDSIMAHSMAECEKEINAHHKAVRLLLDDDVFISAVGEDDCVKSKFVSWALRFLRNEFDDVMYHNTNHLFDICNILQSLSTLSGVSTDA